MASEITKPTLEQFTENWYDWETIYENLDARLTSEEMISINSGFGTTEGSSKLFDPIWNEQEKVFYINGYKVRRSNKINFYKGAGLYEITNLSENSAPVKKVIMLDRFDIYLNKDLFILSDTNSSIYAANEFFGLSLFSDRNIIDYFLFFFYNVKGQHGHFYPVRSRDEVEILLNFSNGTENLYSYNWETEEFKLSEDQLILKPQKPLGSTQVLQVPTNAKRNGDEILIEKSILIFKESLFCTDVTIQANDGQISLLNERLLYEAVRNPQSDSDNG